MARLAPPALLVPLVLRASQAAMARQAPPVRSDRKAPPALWDRKALLVTMVQLALWGPQDLSVRWVCKAPLVPLARKVLLVRTA